MKRLNMNPFLYLFAGFSLFALLVAALIRGLALTSPLTVIRLIPDVATADVAAYFVFTTWLWRWKLLSGWLIPFPDLNGTWYGHIEASGDTKLGPIPAMLTVKQSFGHINCVMRTAEMESRSYLEGFSIDAEAQVRRLCYSYTSRPNSTLRHRSTPHDGTALINIIGSPASKLVGEYWTQRQTLGSISLSYLTPKHLDEMPQDAPAHPMIGRAEWDRGAR